MTNINDPENDGQSTHGEFPVHAYYYTEEGEVWDASIGEVTLPLGLLSQDFPFELSIDGVTYKREE